MAFSELGGKIGAGLDGITSVFSGLGLANEENETVMMTPDRQSQLGAGAFLSVSQQSVSPQTTGRHQNQRTESSFDAPASMETQGERFFVVETGVWTTNDLRFVEMSNVYLPSIFNNPKMSVFGHLAYHAYIRADFEVQIMINATNFQQGSILCVAVPHWACVDDKGDEAYKVSYASLLTLPHALLNCNVNNSGAFGFPWLHTRNMKSIHNQPRDIWCLKVMVWSPLSVATGTSTRVTYRILARMKNLELHGLRPFHAQMMRMIVAPGMGALNTSNRQGTVPAYDMSLGPENFPLDATMAGGLQMKSLAKQIMTPCFLTVMVMNTMNQHQGHLLGKVEIGPEMIPLQFHGVHHPTNLCALSKFYRYWRGDIIVTFQVMCTKFHSGRVMVSYVPELSMEMTFEDHMSSSVLMFDINGVSSTAKFRVPFMSETMYRPTSSPTGLLTVWVLNELTAPDTVSHTVEVVVMIAGAENFQFFAPTWDEVAQGDSDEPVEELQPEEAPKKIDAASVVEDPNMLISDDGTFPEISPGKRTHSQPHTDTDVILGRMRMMQSVLVTQSGGGTQRVPVRFTTNNGPLRGLLRFGYLLRGTLRLAVSIANGAAGGEPQATVRAGFFPHPMPTNITWDRFTSVGFVSFNTATANSVVLKLPWYTNLAAINLWGGDDVDFGHIYLDWFTSRAMSIDLMVSVSGDTQILFPMPCQISENYPMRLRLKAAVPSMDVDKDVFRIEGPGKLGIGLRAVRGPTMDESGIFITSVDKRSPLYGLGVKAGDLIESVNKRSLIGVSKARATEILRGDRPLDLTIVKAAAHYYGLSMVKKRTYKIFLEEFEHESDEDMEPDKQDDDTASMESFGPQAEWEDTDYKAQSMEVELVSRPSIMGMRHYGVRLNKGIIVDLVPKNGPFSREGEIKVRASTSEWRFEGYSDEPALSIEAALSALGDHPYHLLTHNCETWARSICFQSKEGQVEKILKTGVCTSGVLMGVGIKAMTAQSGHGKPVPPTSKKPNFLFKRAISLVDSTNVATETTNMVRNVDKRVEEVTVKAEELMTDIRTKLDPAQLFKSIGKKRMVKAGARVTGFLLGTLSSLCEFVALCTTTDPKTRALLLAALGARVAAEMVNLVLTVVDTMGAQTFELFEECELCDDPIMQPVFEGIVNQQWEKHMGEEFTPQGGIMVLARNIGTLGFALKTMTGFTDFMRKLFEQFLAWLKPKTEEAQSWKLAKKAGRELINLNLTWTKVAAMPTGTLEEKVLKRESAKELLKESKKLLEAIEANYSKKDHSQTVTGITVLQGKILKAVSEVIQTGGATRTEPVVCYMAGRPGSGKSLSANALAFAICKKLGVDPDFGIYSKPNGTDFWDGYGGQSVMIVDDVGQNTSGEDWENFCQIVSTAPLRLNMASLEDKGTEFKTPYILATSNDVLPTPNVLSDSQALHRRLTMTILVEPHPSYTKKDGCLDVALAQKAGALKGMSCCLYKPYDITHKTSGQVTTFTQEPITFMALVKDFFNSYIEKMALTGHMRLMMEEVFAQAGVKFVGGEETVAGLELASMEALHLKQKRMKKILYIGGVMTAIIGALGMVGCIAAIAVNASKKKSHEPKRAYNIMNQSKPKPHHPSEMRAQRHVEVAVTVKKNMVRLGKVRDGKHILTGNGFFVTPHVLACVTHCIRGGENLLIEEEDEFLCLSPEEYEVHELDGDISCIVISSRRVRPRRNILGSIASEGDLGKVHAGHAVAYTCTGEVLPFTALRSQESFSYPDPVNKGERIVVPQSIKGVGVAMVGACGSPWVSTNTTIGCRIFGVHIAGSDSHSVCQVFTREMVDRFSEYEPQCKIMSVEPAPFKVNSAGPSKIVKSALHPYLECKREPAPMGWWDPRAEGDPEAQIILKHRSPLRVEPPDWYVCEQVALLNGTELMEQVKRVPGPLLDFREAMEGIHGLEGVDMNTSAGLPWSQASDPNKRKKINIVHTDEFREKVDEIVDFIMNPFDNERKKPVLHFSVHLKDELISDEKVKAGRTRFIAAAPFHFVVAARICFGRAVSVIHKTNPATDSAYGIAVGMNPDKDFTYLALVHPDRKVLAVDYSNFDGSLQPFVMRSACRILAAMCDLPVECGDRFADLMITTHQVCNDTQYNIYGALASGAPFTSIIGSLCNYLMLVYTMSKIAYIGMHRVSDFCKIVTYGDDVLMKVDEGLEFSAERFSEIMYSTFGATTTDALDKNSPPMLRELWDVTFLKRGFRQCGENPFLCHPVMCEGTIASLLSFKRKGTTYQEMIRNAVMFVWHHGREQYNSFCSMVKWLSHAIPDRERAAALSELAPYDDLHHDWMENP